MMALSALVGIVMTQYKSLMMTKLKLKIDLTSLENVSICAGIVNAPYTVMSVFGRDLVEAK